ncbi:MAG: DUF899 domain-containing protein [Streptosporangiaceae bacterium]|nr:DUF899 domain-containing protein [Streptosporangiaceae bacterium]
MSLPDVVSRAQWLEARERLLAEEKELTRKRDALNADRRRLPMVRITENYVFEGPTGKTDLAGLFGDSRQLIVQHVMFGPDWEQPCPSCSVAISEMTPSLFKNLRSRDTNFVLVSRAPYAKIAEAATERNWDVPWYSSHGSDFNFDFEVSFDKSNPPLRYNYREQPWLLEADAINELPGLSCFLREGDDVFHTYSTFARGAEYIGNAYTLLDLTALGRQESWEEPKDRVQTDRAGDPSFTA